MEQKIPLARVFPVYVVGRRSGNTIKWWHNFDLYICGIDKVEEVAQWDGIKNGELCRVLATKLTATASGANILTISFAQRIGDQTATVEEIIENSNLDGETMVGKKDSNCRLVVPQLDRDATYKVTFPMDRKSQIRFNNADANDKIEVPVMHPQSRSRPFFFAPHCTILQK